MYQPPTPGCCTVLLKPHSRGPTNLLVIYFSDTLYLEHPVNLLSILLLNSVDRMVCLKEKAIITSSTVIPKELQRLAAKKDQW